MRKFKTAIVIDQSKWVCGKSSLGYTEYISGNSLGEGYSSVKNPDGFMCCMGQALFQLVPEANQFKEESDFGFPAYFLNYHQLKEIIPLLTEDRGDGVLISSEFTRSAVRINDNPLTTIEEKKNALHALGNLYDVEFVFI